MQTAQPTSRAEINRRNAQFSTGPRSCEGKAASSLNAVKTALTGRTVLLPSEDAPTYEQHLADYAGEYKPAGLRERELVQSLADTSWRLERIPGLESALYTRGRLEFAPLVAFQAPEHRAALLDLETHLQYERQLRNLHVQEGRLTRRYDKEMKELRSLQNERQAAAKTKTAQPLAPSAASAHPAAAQPSGFVFSNQPVATPTAIPAPMKEDARPEPAAR